MIYEISNEDFMSIMNVDEFDLPKRWSGGDFHRELSILYEKYQIKLRGVLPINEYVEVRNICMDILAVLESYLNGYIKEAYDAFYRVMDVLSRNLLKEYIKWDGGTKTCFDDPLKLYRVRNIQGNTLINRKQIFHTPITLRSKIASCRFSISGFPSLYLGTSLDLCIEESPASAFNDQIIASRFELNRHYADNGNVYIKVIELAIRPSDFRNYRNTLNEIKKGLEGINLESQTVRLNYLLWYPLIAACSYMRTNKSDPFAPEYIVPQYLMQWTRSGFSNNLLIGIRYFSCASERASRMGYNYVFPVSGEWREPDNDFCRVLAKAFKFTDPRYLREYDNVQELESALNKLAPNFLS